MGEPKSDDLESHEAQAENERKKELEENVTSSNAEKEGGQETGSREEQTAPATVRTGSSARHTDQQPQASGQASGQSPSRIVVAEEITVGMPLFRPKKEFLKILKNGGADCDFLTKRELCRYLREYIGKRRLYNPYDPREVNCGDDELGRVFGVQRFTISDVLQLIQRNCYQLPDMCLKRKQVLVSRPAPRDLSSETSAATTTQVTQIPGERRSPVVCINLSRPTSIITSSTSPSTSGGASVQSTSVLSTSTSSQGRTSRTTSSQSRTSRSTSSQGATSKESRRQKRRPKRRQKPKQKKAEKGCTDQNQPSTSGNSFENPAPMYIKVKVETESDSDQMSIQQDGSSSKIEDSSDDLWLLEEEGRQASDTFSIEYELEDSEPSDILSESSSVASGQYVSGHWSEEDTKDFEVRRSSQQILTVGLCDITTALTIRIQYVSGQWSEGDTCKCLGHQVKGQDHNEKMTGIVWHGNSSNVQPADIIFVTKGVIVVCSDSDVEFWADESDTEWNEGDQWTCGCGTKNTPVQRHCIFCWKIRPGWLGEKRARSPSSEEMERCKKVKEDYETISPEKVKAEESLKLDSIDSGICLSSQDTALSQTTELNHLGTRRTMLNYCSKQESVENKGPEDPCVICLKRPKTGSIIHGSTGHQVCCYPCAKRLKRRKRKCPVCRRPIKSVIRNFVL
ncbi:E3 ubiquitin-protein ligase Mdm2-like isoform X2 [Ostrea edulis]|nr:E3 ubiquitin-protein ligase Mdm2-like isoform X2 [Ostrea edulis]